MEVLKLIGLCFLVGIAMIGLQIVGYLQATWNMTPEEKKNFNDYIIEHGIITDSWD